MDAPNARLVGWSTPWARWAWLFELPRATPITPSSPRPPNRAESPVEMEEGVGGGGPSSAIHQSRKRPPSPSQFALIASLAESHWKFVFPQPTQMGTYCSATLPSTSRLVPLSRIASPHHISQPANPPTWLPWTGIFLAAGRRSPLLLRSAQQQIIRDGEWRSPLASPDCQSNVLTT